MAREVRTMLFKTVDFVRVCRAMAKEEVDVIVRARTPEAYTRLRAAMQSMTQEAVDWFPEAQGDAGGIEIEGSRVAVTLGDAE